MEGDGKMSRKSICRMVFGLSAALVLAACTLLEGTDAIAQTAPGVSDGKTDEIGADALACWWRSDKSSIRIGEEFTITLTCRSAETAREKTVVNDALLDPGAVALPPFQVKNGMRYRDLVRILPGPEGTVTFRSVQYSYTVKLLGEGFFGKDVPLPPLEIRYHIDLVTDKDTVTPGKEQIYLLPALPMRIQSIVPRGVDTIRDGGAVTFGDAEGHRKKSIVLFVAAGILMLLPIGVMLPVLVRALRSRRPSASNGTVFQEKNLLRRLSKELNRVERRRRTAPWDDASIGPVLSLFRVAGALALGRRIIQTPVSLDTVGYEGQLKFHKGFWPRTKVLVSASLTPEDMAGDLADRNRQDAAAAERSVLLNESQEAFTAFNNARYATPGDAAGQEVLDGGLKAGLRLLKELRRDRCTAVRMSRKISNLWVRWVRKWKRS